MSDQNQKPNQSPNTGAGTSAGKKQRITGRQQAIINKAVEAANTLNASCLDLDGLRGSAEVTAEQVMDGFDKWKKDRKSKAIEAARKKIDEAEKDIKTSDYSRYDLFKWLKPEGFTEEEAEYAADCCGVDWKAQAVADAVSFLNCLRLESRSDLVSHLKFVKFTEEEVEYAVDHCGVDWKERALDRAKNTLRFNDFSSFELETVLKCAGFTSDEAMYAVLHCGKYVK